MIDNPNRGESKYVIVYTGAVSRGNPGRAGAGAMLVLPPRRVYVRLCRFLGNRTNNDAEYQPLLMGLNRALDSGFRQVVVRSSSELMVNQLKGLYSVKSAALQHLHHDAEALLRRFDHWHAEHVPRQQNPEPYRLANKATDLHLERKQALGEDNLAHVRTPGLGAMWNDKSGARRTRP